MLRARLVRRRSMPRLSHPSHLCVDSKSDPGQELRFGRSQRLLKRQQFLATQKRGVKAHGRHLMVIAAKGRPGQLRLGVTASKKVGGAVQRNRAKRLLREAFRHLRADWPPGYDLVVVARASLAQQGLEVTLRDLARSVTQAIKRLQKDKRTRGR